MSIQSLLESLLANAASLQPATTATPAPTPAPAAAPPAPTPAPKPATTATPAAPGLQADADFAAQRKRDTEKAALPTTSIYADETERILALPEVYYEGCDWTPKLRKPSGEQILRDLQSAALEAVAECGGGFFPIGTGWGKTLIAVLSGAVLPDVDYVVIITPSSMEIDFTSAYFEARKHWKTPDLEILSISKMSAKPQLIMGTPTDLLDVITQGLDLSRVLIAVDEAHLLKDRQSARTRRFERFIEAHPQVRCVFLSGSMTDKSILDCAHLAAWALREKSPLPRDGVHLAAWAQVLDAKGKPGAKDWKIFHPVWKRYHPDIPMASVSGRDRAKLARGAFLERMRSCPGVVASEETSLDIALQINGLQLGIPDDVIELMVAVDDSGTAPTGDVIPDDVTRWRLQRQLSQGFYYRWDWRDQAGNPSHPDTRWLDARRDWNRHVRNELLNHAAPGYDSQLLVYLATLRVALARWPDDLHELFWQIAGYSVEDKPVESIDDVPFFEEERFHDLARVERALARGRSPSLVLCWFRWAVQRHKAPPPTVHVWVSTYLVEHALKWAEEAGEPVILWYDSLAVEDKLRQAGLPVYGAGDQIPPKCETVALSIRAHGVGKNLQRWRKQLIISPPAGAKAWEQMLARTHRPGQNAATVEAYTYQHTDAFVQALASAIDVARYVQATSGNGQKLLHADYKDCRVPLDILTKSA